MAWNGLVRRVIQLYIGLLLYGLAGALQVRSGLGLDPWDVLHQGLSRHLGLAIGTFVIIVGAAVLVLWIPLRQRPGVGTISNVVLIGVSMNASLMWLPGVHQTPWRITDMLAGVLLCGVATGMYIGANLGPGPRDGLMTGLARRTGRSIRLTRTSLEVTVLRRRVAARRDCRHRHGRFRPGHRAARPRVHADFRRDTAVPNP